MLQLAVIFLAAAVVAVPIFKRLGLGSVLGYLAAGLIIGPSGLSWITNVNVEESLHTGEFGVVLLLFLIGLELEPARLWRMRTAVFGLGGLQVIASAAVIAIATRFFGVPWPAATVIGLALAMSSTAFATQILGERNELGMPHGRTAFGILLFQDLAAIPVIALVPVLGGVDDEGGAGWPAIAVVIVVILAGRFLLQPAFRVVASVRSQELSTAAALLLVVATALLMEAVGLSQELGAFLAGVLLADSEYRHDLEASIEPFKGLLLGLFFIGVGMSADVEVLIERPVVIVAAALAVVATKAAVLYGTARLGRLSRPESRRAAIVISQGGEFAFVIFALAHDVALLDPKDVECLIMIVTLSMCTTPVLLIIDDALRARAVRGGTDRDFDAIDDHHSAAIIAGFGRFGQIVGRVMRLHKFRFTALDSNAEHVDFVRKFGSKIYYGDASRVDLLRAAGAERAQLFVLAIDDFEASMRTLDVVQRNFPHLTIVARARNRQHAYALLGAGVEHVIRETLAGSLEAAQIALEQLGVPSSSAHESVRQFAEFDEDAVRKSFHLRDDEKALIENSKHYAEQLRRIFEADADAE